MVEKKIDGVEAIRDYTHCKVIQSCEVCECLKPINIDGFNNLCEFLRTYTAVARSKIDEALNTVL